MSKKSRTPRPSSSTAMTPAPTAASRSDGDPTMLVIALIGTTLFVGAYYHLLVLQQMTQLTGGLAVPD